MIHDDKTTEIILPTVPKEKPSHSETETKPLNSQVVSSGAPIAISPEIALVKTHWLHSLQEELSQDWTLRVLAALTILALSLLVL